MTIKELFKDAERRRKHLGLPMLKERNSFLEELTRKGYNSDFLIRAARYLMWALTAMPYISSRSELIRQDEIVISMHSYCEANSISISQEKRAIQMTVKFLRFTGLYDLDGLSGTPVLNSLFRGLISRKRVSSVPMLEEREAFLAHCRKKGYSDSCLTCIANMQIFAVKTLKLDQVQTVTEEELHAAAYKHMEIQSLKRTLKTGHSQRTFFRHISKWLIYMDMYNLKLKDYHFKEQIDLYLKHLTVDRNLSPLTIKGRRKVLRTLSRFIAQLVVSLSDLNTGHIDQLIAMIHGTGKVSRRSIASYVGALRGFLRFAASMDWCDRKLIFALKAPRIYSEESIPYAPTKSQVESAVGFYADSDEPACMRNHAIMLLLSVYGIRTHELVNLTLDDLDWENETITIHRSKGERTQRFPLTASVGNAIIKYLMKGRNNSTESRVLFQCMMAPFRDITHSTIYPIVSNALKPLNTGIKHKGPHSLRHWTATHLVNEGFPLYNVSRQLGHESLDSTRVYAKVNLTQLRKVTDIDMEDLL